ncbi:hypothetical protein [Halorubrum californiense]|uniref:hypothetical protein n=1 Tax=Halorubrum californiense TaxID=416585 RepID=UPI0012694D7C|nr:hypothetical protein [Halorubrum californiense]
MSGVQPVSTLKQSVEATILAGVGGLLVAIHLLFPASLRTELAFTYGEPSLVSAWTAAAVHDSWSHLVSNVAWYGVVVGSTYVLLAKRGRRRTFWLATAGCVVVAPPVTKLVDYWVLLLQWEVVAGITTASGFSGVVSAFGGMLYVVLLGTVTAWYGYAAGVAASGTVTAASLTVLSVTSDVLPEIAGITLAVTSVILFVIGAYHRALIQRMRRAWAHDRDAGVRVGIGWGVVVVLIAVLFQVELDATRRFVNVVAHGTGFTTGMMVTLSVISGRRVLGDRN